MSFIAIRAQMVRVNKIEEKDIKNSTDKLKIAYFSVADRDRHQVRTGTANASYETDAFYFCKAIGHNAKLIEEYFNKKDESGKLISRKLYIVGKIIQFENSKEELIKMPLPAEKVCESFGLTCPDSLKGKTANLEKKASIKYNDYMVEVTAIEFEDKDPDKAVKTQEGEVKISLDGVAPAGSIPTANFDLPNVEMPVTTGNPFLD